MSVITRGSFDGESHGTAAISFDEKKGFNIKKFNIEGAKKEKVYISRAKPCHVMVMRYNKKDKQITLNLERTTM